MLGIVPVYSPFYTTAAEGIQVMSEALDVLAARDGNHEQVAVDSIQIAPYLAQSLGEDPEALDAITKRINNVLAYAGGNITPTALSALTAKIEVVNLFGSTEMGAWPTVQLVGACRKDKQLGYISPHPAANIHFDPVTKTNNGEVLYEAVLTRNDGKAWNGYVQPLFKVHTEAREIRSGDLYTKHPTIPNLWLHNARADDMLVLLTTEKFLPTVAENKIAGHPGVVEAMMVGTSRSQISLILRLKPGVDLDGIWKVVEQVNNESPAYARVKKHMVLITEEPFLHTPKGTLDKRSMLEFYAKELDHLYERHLDQHIGAL